MGARVDGGVAGPVRRRACGRGRTRPSVAAIIRDAPSARSAPPESGRRWRRRALGRGAAGAGGLAWAVPVRVASGQSELVAEELRIVSFQIFEGLDPTYGESAWVMRGVGAGEALLKFSPSGEPEPELARSIELLDPTTWRVGLRPGATFWSGAPADAAAVIRSLERTRALWPPAAPLLDGVRLEAPDEWTVLFRSDRPAPGLALNLANDRLVIHNADVYGSEVNTDDLSRTDLTGAFRFTAFEPGSRALLERNERYWGAPPRTRRIEFEEVLDQEARTLVALSGEAHLVHAISPSSARQIERSRDMRLVQMPRPTLLLLSINTQRPPFDDVRVRQAFSWAVDREELVQLAFDGHSSPAPSLLAVHPGYPEARRTGYTRPDLRRAGELLDAAGWRLPPGASVRAREGTPLRFRLLYNSSGNRLVAEVLQAQWAKVGAEVSVQGAADSGFALARQAQGDWELATGTYTVFGDPPPALRRFAHPEGDANPSRFADQGLLSLLDGFGGLVDAEERRQQALRINERTVELVPLMPLAQSVSLAAVGRRMRNYVPNYPLFYPYDVHPDLWAER
jgi:peptide/nickel transport system substrate-binding protein